MHTIQYLEYSPDLGSRDKSTVVSRLRAAAACFPFSHLLVGWHVPQPLLEACREEADHLGLRFLRWQPLLTTDRGIQVDPSWYTTNLAGNMVQGYRGSPEFNFLCPNHPGLQEALVKHLDGLLQEGIYQGFFLDRIRFPSPSADPDNDLACFCEQCCRKAARESLDLKGIRQTITQQLGNEQGRISLVKNLLSGSPGPVKAKQDQALTEFLTFRQRSISDFLALITQSLRASNLEIGLDCFSPGLAPMVGQSLRELSSLVDWVKVMTYGHTFAPAGLPFELSGFIRYLTHMTPLDERQALDLVRNSANLPLPEDVHSMETLGLSSSALQQEVVRAVATIGSPVLAGIELADLQGVTQLTSPQIQADLAAIKRARPAGLAISWDLWHIPLDKLELARKAYFEEQ